MSLGILFWHSKNGKKKEIFQEKKKWLVDRRVADAAAPSLEECISSPFASCISLLEQAKVFFGKMY